MTAEKPIILLVHGAWHRPLHYRSLIEALQKEQFTVIAPPLASSGYDDSIAIASHTDDMKRIHDAILPHINDGKTVLAVGHSYGAVPLGEALKGYTTVDRAAKGLSGGFNAAVFISPAPALVSGISMLEAASGSWSTAWFHDVTDTRLPVLMDKAPGAFYPDVEASIRDQAMSHIAEQSTLPFTTTIINTPADVDLPKTLVVCDNDIIFPKELQVMTAEKWGATQVHLESGHSPWMNSCLDTLVHIIVDAANKDKSHV